MIFVDIIGQGPPLVLFHGWGFNREIMRPLAARLSLDFEVHLMDLPLVDCYSLATLGSALRPLIPAGAVLVGWSLGGLVALELLREGGFHSAVLLASSPCFIAAGDWPGIDGAVFDAFAASVTKDPLRALQKFVFLQAPELYREHLPTQVMSRESLSILRETDFRNTSFKAPLQVILGEKDALLPVDLATHLSHLWPQADLVSMPGLGHMAFWQDREGVVEHILPRYRAVSLQKNKKRVAQAFSKAALAYDQAAHFQFEVMEELGAMTTRSLHILDIGCGTGVGTRHLALRYPDATVIGLDLAVGMIDVAALASNSEAYLCADFDHLPIQSGWADLVFSNLSLQWSPDLKQTLFQLKAALAPGGQLIFSTLQSGTLREFQSLSMNSFLHAEEIEASLLEAGFAIEQSKAIRKTYHYPTFRGVLGALKDVGANCRLTRHAKQANRAYFEGLEAAYPRDSEGFPLTYEVVLIVARRKA